MPKLLQINVDTNNGSNGSIARDIGTIALSKGWESYIAYSGDAHPSQIELIKIGSMPFVFEHYLENKLLNGVGAKAFTETIIHDINI